jgi:hypothetical protein
MIDNQSAEEKTYEQVRLQRIDCVAEIKGAGSLIKARGRFKPRLAILLTGLVVGAALALALY